MVLPLVQKTKLAKALGPSNINADISKASPDQCSQLIAVLINALIKEGKVPEESNNRYIVCSKTKNSALDRGNYCSLKLIDHVLKVVERVLGKNHQGVYSH